MFDSLTGTLIHADPKTAVVSCGGVGFKCAISLHTAGALPGLNEGVTLYTHLVVREDALELFGFAEQTERELFKLLIGVSGVGAKVAVAVLSSAPPDRLMLAIAAGDAAAVRAPGVGPKIAGRIIMELQGKLGDLGADYSDMAAVSTGKKGASGEAVAALTALGFSATDAASAIGKCDPAAPVEELVRQALKTLARQ